MAAKKKSFIVAMDIGYSNTKVCYGSSDEDKVISIIPSTAARADKFRNNFLIDPNPHDQFTKTIVDGREWYVGCPISSIEGYVREKHDGFTESPHYRAILNSILINQPRNKIDRVVMSLPVNQYYNDRLRSELQSTVIGTHQVTTDRTVQVLDCEIYSQPAGCFFHFVTAKASHEDLDVVETMPVIFLDIGYYSIDLEYFDKSTPHKIKSFSSQNAIYRVLRKTCDQIGQTFNQPCFADRLEEALQRNEDELQVGNRFIKFDQYLSKSASQTAKDTIVKINNSSSELDTSPPLIVTTGGGAKLFESSLINAFPESKIVTLEITIIAEGLWEKGYVSKNCRA
jgi:plasmid segregation protein ParM